MGWLAGMLDTKQSNWKFPSTCQMDKPGKGSESCSLQGQLTMPPWRVLDDSAGRHVSQAGH